MVLQDGEEEEEGVPLEAPPPGGLGGEEGPQKGVPGEGVPFPPLPLEHLLEVGGGLAQVVA